MADQETEQKERPTTRGYSGSPEEEGAPRRVLDKNLPRHTVISPVGVTKPTEVVMGNPYRREPSGDEQIAGKAAVKGRTHHGYVYEQILEFPQPVTEDGVFFAFKSHHPDAIREGFEVKPVTDAEADELAKQWTKEHEEKQNPTTTDKNGGTKNGGTRSNGTDYDSMTVADLRSHMDERGVEYKHDWNKGDHIKALQKADKEK